MDDLPKNETEWKTRLDPDAYYVMREKGTEPPYTGEYDDCKREGIYHCKGCESPLFRSEDKFDSGSGWPSYYEAIPGALELKEDLSHGMVRTEALCKRCGSHLGHLFEGTSTSKGQHYCINSVALKLNPHP